MTEIVNEVTSRPNRRITKICRLCGGEYWGRKHGYCSRTCGEAARVKHLASVTAAPLVRGLKNSAITQADEKFHSAKNWSLKSPHGEVFVFRNLANFVRTHRSLFLRADLKKLTIRKSFICRATTGLAQLRPGRKMKKQPESWKGWAWHNQIKYNL